MKLFCLLLISLMGLKATANEISNDPAQSGPSSFLKTLYAVESHESYNEPSQLPWESDDTTSTTLNNQDEFVSSLSSENVEYIENREIAQTQPLKALSDSSEIPKSVFDAEDYSTSSDVDISANKCNLSEPSSRLQSYIGLGDEIIRKDKIYNARDYDSTVETKATNSASLEIDVTHDVFETTSSQGGLLPGIIYKGKKKSSH